MNEAQPKSTWAGVKHSPVRATNPEILRRLLAGQISEKVQKKLEFDRQRGQTRTLILLKNPSTRNAQNL
jgi:hypothetical protein